MAIYVRELLGREFDAEATIFLNEPPDPGAVIAEEDHILCGAHEQAVDFEDFGAFRIAARSLKPRKGDIVSRPSS